MVTEESAPRRERRPADQGKPTAKTVQAAFVACGRCGFFLAAYRLNHDDFEEAAGRPEDNWLVLSGDDNSRHLLHKSFGCRFEVDTYHLEGTCPECHRRFVYDRGVVSPTSRQGEPPPGEEPPPKGAEPSPQESASLRIQITPA